MSTPTHMTKHPRDWTEFERASFARTRIAEAIVRLIAGGASYDEATAIAFAEVNRRWPNLLAAMIRDDRERRGLDYAKVEAQS
jgi:hypothetical protein